MKSIFVLFFTLLSTVSFGQVNRDVVMSFWNSNIKAIVDMDKEKIIRQTNFPVEGSWGYLLELEDKPENKVESVFTDNLDKIFNEETRKQLSEKTYNDLVHHKNEAGEIIFIVNVVFDNVDPETGYEYESSTLFFFKLFDNKWKLYSVEFAG